jgi:hypothetical protein
MSTLPLQAVAAAFQAPTPPPPALSSKPNLRKRHIFACIVQSTPHEYIASPLMLASSSQSTPNMCSTSNGFAAACSHRCLVYTCKRNQDDASGRAVSSTHCILNTTACGVTERKNWQRGALHEVRQSSEKKERWIGERGQRGWKQHLHATLPFDCFDVDLNG